MATRKLATIQPLLTSTGAGHLLGMTGRAVRDLAAKGMLPAVRLPGSRQLKFRPESLAQLVAASEAKTSAE